jgi:nicotinate-nucleotide adenylyltransferase
MKIGVFGGTFDPPHIAHTTLVTEVLRKNIFDQVWYLPVAVHQPQFAKNAVAIDHRLTMLSLIQNEKTRIELFEVESKQASHTHSTLRALQEKYPEYHFSFLMGADQMAKLHLWNCDQDKACFPQAADEFDYYVYPRKGFDLVLPFSNLKVVEDVTPMEVSSTQVREKIMAGESVDTLLEPQVLNYIVENNLYGAI